VDGLVDIHAHLLPGIDDGPTDLAGSLEMARCAVASGIVRLAATPHLRSDFPGVQVGEIPGRAAELQRELDGAGIALEVVAGAEASLLWALDASDEELRLASYGQLGRDLLVETPADVSMLDRLLSGLQARGLRIVLAHPERSATFRQDPSRLARLSRQGVLLQVNADVLLSRTGSSTRQLAESLCRDGVAQLLASDGHRGADWRPVDRLAQAASRLTALTGAERAAWMVSQAPAAVLEGRPLPPAPASRLRPAFWTGRRR
jgi:protein-tyrosine phosphatase